MRCVALASKSDFRIVNLKTPLVDANLRAPIKKAGPNLISPPKCITFLKVFGTDIVTLANNHIGDFGDGALSDTLQVLSENGIRYCGAGFDIEHAYDACRIEKHGISASLISVCENEFGIATEKAPGSAGYDARRLLIKHQ